MYTTLINNKTTWEINCFNGWYGDEYTPVRWRVEALSIPAMYRMVHLHDIDTNKCVKNRSGEFCN